MDELIRRQEQADSILVQVRIQIWPIDERRNVNSSALAEVCTLPIAVGSLLWLAQSYESVPVDLSDMSVSFSRKCLCVQMLMRSVCMHVRGDLRFIRIINTECLKSKSPG